MRLLRPIIVIVLAAMSFSSTAEHVTGDELLIAAYQNSLEKAKEQSEERMVSTIKDTLREANTCLLMSELIEAETPSLAETRWETFDEYKDGVFLALEYGLSTFGTTSFRENAERYTELLRRHYRIFATAVVFTYGNTDVDGYLERLSAHDDAYRRNLRATLKVEEGREVAISRCQKLVETVQGYDVHFGNRAQEHE